MKLKWEMFFHRKTVIRPTARAWLLILLVLVMVFVIPYQFWFTKAAESLVLQDPLAASDVIFIEDWDYPEFRNFAAAARVQQRGFADRIIIFSNDGDQRLRVEGADSQTLEDKVIDLYCREAGIRAGSFEKIWSIPSEPATLDRARQVAQVFQVRGIHSAILISRHYHSKRSTLSYRRFLDPAHIRLISYPAGYSYKPNNWWRSREGIQTVTLEFLKLVLYRLFFV